MRQKADGQDMHGISTFIQGILVTSITQVYVMAVMVMMQSVYSTIEGLLVRVATSK